MTRKTLSFLLMALVPIIGWTQNSYIPYKTFDGEHRNEISGYVMGGNNVVTGRFVGLEASYTRHLTPRWHVGADAQMQFGKQLFSIDVQGGYRLPVKYGNISFDGKVMSNYYHKYRFHEMSYNLSVTWESAYASLRIGESFVHYHKRDVIMGWGYSEPPLLTFGFGANIRHRDNPWNMGLFFRNYDDFYYENWNINWGIRWYAKLQDRWHLFGEFNIRPAGSMSQLASKYEGSVKIGLKHKW